MKPKLIVLLIVLMSIVFILFGCQEEKMSASDVLTRTIESVNDTNSYAFEMEMNQDTIIPRYHISSTSYSISGRLTTEPVASEVAIEIDMEGMKMDMKMYFVDDLYYLYVPDLGWGWQDANGEIFFSEAYIEPFEYINMLQKIDSEIISIEKEDGQLLLSYVDDQGVFAEFLKEDFLEAFEASLSDIDLEIRPEEMAVSGLSYALLIDSNNFLPTEETIEYQLLIETEDEDIIIELYIVVKYLEFDTFDSIVVPEEIINDAVPYEELQITE